MKDIDLFYNWLDELLTRIENVLPAKVAEADLDSAEPDLAICTRSGWKTKAVLPSISQQQVICWLTI